MSRPDRRMGEEEFDEALENYYVTVRGLSAVRAALVILRDAPLPDTIDQAEIYGVMRALDRWSDQLWAALGGPEDRE